MNSATHYPDRHNGGLNVLYYDGHVQWRKPAMFRVSDFREPGSGPVPYADKDTVNAPY